MSLTLPVILTLIGLTLSISIPLITHILKARKENRLYYSVIWKSSAKLKPKDILGERPYNDFYFTRDEDSLLKEHLGKGNNVLITGPPLAGKTRAFYEQVRHMKKKADMLVPRNIAMPVFVFPSSYKFRRHKIIFIDDLQYFVEKQENYHLLFRKAEEKKISIISTCHTGLQFKKVKNKLLEQNLELETMFDNNVIEYGKISPENAMEISSKMHMDWDKVKFNGTVGSIFMRLSEMERRFDNADNIEKTIMNTIRMMYISGLWENNIYSLEWIRLASKRFELEGKEFEWAGWLKALEDKEFIKIINRNKVWADDAYLQYVVKPQIDLSDIDIFDEMIEVFSSEPSALVMLGEKAYNAGLADIDIAEYMKLTIKAFSILKEKFEPENNLEYIKACEYMGLSHWKISGFDDTKENCEKALIYLSEALKLISPEKEPAYYARLQSATGNAYVTLADIQDREQNCKKAIECFKESLKYISSEESPLQYASIHHNLGNVYNLLLDADLVDITERPKNLKLAIESNKKALKIRTLKDHPREYALTNNNMGVSYLYLSVSENKAENLKLAIEYFLNVLKVYDKNKDPITYTLSITNLGYVYSLLAECEDTDKNFQNAIDLLNESLGIRTPDKFPVQYGTTQYTLGAVYLSAAKIKNSPKDCYKALDAFEESLVIRTFDKYPLQYALSRNMMGETYMVLSGFEDKKENSEKAIKEFYEALKVYTEDAYPKNYSTVMENISKLKA